MLSKSRISLIRSLKYRKFRDEHGLFIAEGEKTVNDLVISSGNSNGLFSIETIYGTADWFADKNLQGNGYECVLITDQELRKISLLSAPNKVMALVRIPVYPMNDDLIQENLSLVLDDIQDPGNLGTMVRIAHWFGIGNIICSDHSADIYNPKTVQASMGSIWSVRVFYKDLKAFLKNYYDHSDFPVMGAFLSGTSIYDQPSAVKGLIVLGNESHGISRDLEPFIRTRLYIPPYSEQSRPDSINVAISAAIICYQLRKNGNVIKNSW